METEKKEQIESPIGEKRRQFFNILKRIPAKEILKILIDNKSIVFITLGFVVTIIPKNCLATVLNQPQEIKTIAKEPAKSFVSYLKSYISPKAWVGVLNNGFSEDFYYYTTPILIKIKPLIKKVEPLIIFGSGVLITKLVYEKVLDYEADLCSTVTKNLRTDIKMLEFLLKVKKS